MARIRLSRHKKGINNPRWPVSYVNYEFVSFSHLLYLNLISPLLTINYCLKCRNVWTII